MLLKELKSLYSEELSTLLRRSEAVRQEHFGKRITFSRNYTIPISNFCCNDCMYCAFRPRDPEVPEHILSPETIRAKLRSAREEKCWEILLMTGEGGDNLPGVRGFLQNSPWTTLVDYSLWVMQEAVEYGLLPHSNFGLVALETLSQFKLWNASMGLMLESCSKELSRPGMPHAMSPGKDPARRLEFIRWAGELQIPFTTGILIGIGETVQERLESLLAIQTLAVKYGHIQEIIIQNFVPHPATPLKNLLPPTSEELLRLVAVARLLFKGTLSIQVAPNLIPHDLELFLRAGASDVGGISPLTIDYVNPNEIWPTIKSLEKNLSQKGYSLVPRLPVYDAFISPKFLSPRILANIASIKKELQTSENDERRGI